MSTRETDTYPASVWRNIVPGTVTPQGQVPPPAYGMWFVSCDHCGVLGNGITGLYGNPVTAGNVAERHNHEHEEG